MKILAADTSSISCSASVVNNSAVLAELTLTNGETHSRHLMRLIHDVLALSRMTLSDLDGFAVTIGPGTFTGLRIGVSAVKGLAAATNKPVVGISSLDVLAAQAAQGAYLISPLIDARRDEVYFSRYRFLRSEDAFWELKKECEEGVCTPAKAIDDIDEPCIFIGNGAVLYKQVILDCLGEQAFFSPAYQHTIKASAVAFLAKQKFEKNFPQKAAVLVPSYIRKSDAELKAVIVDSHDQD